MSSQLNLVVAFIQPFQLDSVVDALRLLPNFPGMSISEVRGFGRHGAHAPRNGERAEVDPFDTKVRIEVFCRGEEAAAIMNAIREAAHTGHPGDGKVFVLDVGWAMRIRTKSVGADAVLGNDPAAP